MEQVRKMSRRAVRRATALAGVASLLAIQVMTAAAPPAAAATPRGTAAGDPPNPIARGPHVSGVARYQPSAAASASSGAVSSCSAPGGGNYRTDCHSSGRPVNETSVAYDTSTHTFYAGANDYNSYNGQGQDGFYWSADGTTWNDAGPLDLFPHNNNNGAGDPGLAVDSSGVVYYSSLLFNFHRCDVGGLELMRRDPTTGNWSTYQIAADSQSQFQDKPAIALGGGKVYVSWTQFGSCSGSGVTSPIKVAVLAEGAGSAAPTEILSVPGSTYSQGSTIASDGNGGFWIAWEEYPSSTATTGEIELAHYDGSRWGTPVVVSPGNFEDLPSPLPGFSFRDNSFPALAVVNGQPDVVWTSYDTGTGRAYLSVDGGSPAALTTSTKAGDQFFPSIAAGANGGVYVSYSQVNPGTTTYDQWLWDGSSATKVSTASSDPSQDAFFSGQFIGDYNGMAFDGKSAHPIWTDIRGPDPAYSGWEMDSMFASAAGSPGGGGGGGALAVAVAAGTTVPRGPNYKTPVTVTATSGGSGVPGASVTLDILSGSCPGSTQVASGSATTDSSGSTGFTFSTRTAGTYCAEATATAPGYDQGSGSATFTVPVA